MSDNFMTPINGRPMDIFPDGDSVTPKEISSIWRVGTFPRTALQSNGGAAIEIEISLSGRIWWSFARLRKGNVEILQLPNQTGHIRVKRDNTEDPVNVTILATYDQR